MSAYFDENEALLTKLKAMKFDVGIGGMYHADSLLFRALGLHYIKVSPEDIESHAMQFKMGMPVYESNYPSSQVAHKYDIGSLPHFDSYFYRRQFNIQFEYNRWIAIPKWKSQVRNRLPEKYHKSLLDDYD